MPLNKFVQKEGPADCSTGPLFLRVLSLRLAAVAHEPQQEEEHIHEVEIEPECAKDTEPRSGFSTAAHAEVDALDHLRVVSGQTREDEHADRAHCQIECRAWMASEDCDGDI